MIKTNELRIGNIVRHTNVNGTFDLPVCEIGKHICLLWSKNNSEWGVHESQIDGISVTEQILLKAGFEASDYPNYKIKVSALTLTCRIQIGINYSEFGGIYFGDKFRYLHQLQNFIFSVSGQDLKVFL
ncbi:hypothetical protein [Pedobacter nototheniae]|uniref:hypothetical protein n=1 Tax=Pedobacter nototheniae TaxID=2488994 RepID=UPI00103EACD3|nr:hypothetical protein [Pedobacter nototheniae]